MDYNSNTCNHHDDNDDNISMDYNSNTCNHHHDN